MRAIYIQPGCLNEMVDVKKLIDALRYLESTPDLKLQNDEILVRNNEIVLETSMIAEITLISSNGRCNWDAIEILRKNGYNVFPVERDRFGWVIGGISTKVGILTYG